MKIKHNKNLLKLMGFKPCKNKNERKFGIRYKNKALDLVVYAEHTNEQIVVNYLRELVIRNNLEATAGLGIFLSKIWK